MQHHSCPEQERAREAQRVLGQQSLAEQEAGAQHAGHPADGQRDAGATDQAGTRPSRRAGGGVGWQGGGVERVDVGGCDAVEEARVGGAPEHQQAAPFQQQRGGGPGRGPGLQGRLTVSGSPEVEVGMGKNLADFGSPGGEGQRGPKRQRLRGKRAPRDLSFGVKMRGSQGQGYEEREWCRGGG